MEIILCFILAAALVFTGPNLWQIREAIHFTTLLSAWRWAFATRWFWMAATLASAIGSPMTQGIKDQLWYAAAVMLLCPPISILGARRPGSAWWSWFIVVPLLCVMGWPAAEAWRNGVPPEPLEIDAPVVIGYAFVLVMGLGNYFGTCFTRPAILLAAAALLNVSAFWHDRPDWMPNATWSHLMATAGVIAATWWGAIGFRQRSVSLWPLERVWLDFRDTFGIVWARRVQERFNETALRSAWPVRLGPIGFVAEAAQRVDPIAVDAATSDAMEAWLRWLLRRFVDPEWIDSRLRTPAIQLGSTGTASVGGDGLGSR